ncbi:MAG: leucine-rich repeat domain-containing protein [Nitrospirae bacterium]|nr:leucine-rich repeat domain-containing protein [Nitrospirota bacterium]
MGKFNIRKNIITTNQTIDDYMVLRTNDLYGIGNFIAIVAIIFNKIDVRTEVYVFQLDKETEYSDGIVMSFFDMNISDSQVINKFLEDKGKQQVKNIITSFMSEQSKKTNDMEIILQNIEFKECDKTNIDCLKGYKKHTELLHDMSADTKSKELSAQINRLCGGTIDNEEVIRGINECIRYDSTNLYLKGCQLTELPPEIWKLTNLQSLHLSGNQITSLPPKIGFLTKLYTLNLSNNKLTTLPLSLGKLAKLVGLQLYGNQSLNFPPPHIVSQGTEKVLSYLREHPEAGTER